MAPTTLFQDIYSRCTEVLSALPDSTTSYAQENHVEIVKTYISSEPMQAVVNAIVQHCHKPIFIPMLQFVINPSTITDGIYIAAFILCHTVQILLFAPTKWDKTLDYLRDVDKYQHRYPTPPCTDAKVAGIFSLKDLNRSVILLQYAMSRRARANLNVMKAQKPAHKTAPFKGYAEPAFTDYRDNGLGVAENVVMANAIKLSLDFPDDNDNSEAERVRA